MMSIPKRYIHEQAVTQKKFLSRHNRLLHTSIGITHYNLKLSHIWGGLVALKTHGPMNKGCLYTQQFFFHDPVLLTILYLLDCKH